MNNNIRLKKQKPFKRSFGILLPVFSLPGKYGIGTLGKSAFGFIDFLYRAKASYWQLLPMGPTGYGDSPYQSFSSFAGNPYYIDPEKLYEKGLLDKGDLENAQDLSEKIDYEGLYNERFLLLKKAAQKSDFQNESEYKSFYEKSSYWLNDYAIFTALKNHYKDNSRKNFDKYRIKTDEALHFAEKNLKEEIDFQKFIQYEFYIEWKELKQYAEEKSVSIIGDLPLYTGDDSADVWSNPELFCLDKCYQPSLISGVPPDNFSADGQLWGNPCYMWKRHKENNYHWWCDRIKRQFELYDILRIDHFIGISKYYAVNADEETAKNGVWHDGPDKDLINAIQKYVPNGRYIAEDLGILNRRTEKLITLCNYPGMKLLETAFDSGSNNPNLPHCFDKNAVVYTGTHDNNTLLGSIEDMKKSEKRFAMSYTGIKHSGELAAAIIRECFKSTANTAVIPLQDFLKLGKEARINTPATINNNWAWRLSKLPSNTVADDIKALAKLYNRSNDK